MPPQLGPSAPFSLRGPAAPGALAALDGVLERLNIRSNTRASARRYVDALLAAPQGKLRLPALARAAPGPDRPAEESFRHLLDVSNWPEYRLRRALVASAPLAEVNALVVEYATTPVVSGTSRDIVTLVAVGEGWAQPIGWRRAVVPPPSREGEISIEEMRCVLELIGEAGRDYVAVEGSAGGRVPPLIALDWRFGENPRVREAVGKYVPEYLFEVGRELQGVTLVANPDAQREPRRLLHEQLQWPPDEVPPAPQQLRARRPGRRGAEYAAVFGDQAHPRYAISRPGVRASRDGLLGHRPQARVRELAALAETLPEPRAAASLRVPDFMHASEDGWQRHVLLVSALQGVGTGLLTGGAISPVGGAE